MRKTCLTFLLAMSLMVRPCYAVRFDQPLADPAQEARAVALGTELRCVVCQSESINDSQADMAHDMRQLVREKIDAGWSDQKIRDFLRTRYGDFILLRPPFQANTYVLWACPFLLFIVAGGGLFLFFRGRKDNP